MRGKILLPITFAVCLLITFGWHKFIYEPTQREILSMQLETRRLREVEREILQLKERYGDLSVLAATKERQLDEMRKFLPATLMQDKFIDELYRAADSNRVHLVNVQAGEISEGEDVQTQIISVKLEAAYVPALNFIREIIDGGRMVSLENFSMTSDGQGITTCELDFKIFATVNRP